MRCGPVFCRSPYGFGTLSDICGVYWRDFAIFVRDISPLHETEADIYVPRRGETGRPRGLFDHAQTGGLGCHYCYYLDKAVQYGGRQAVMDDQLLELCIKQYIRANEVDTVQFCWHGGEPLLLGLDFYRRAMELQRRYADGKRIENTLQTNGTLVDEAWCDLFAANNFLVGLSLDGPGDIHDAFRLTRGGKPTFERVMRTVGMFAAAWNSIR